MTGYESKKAMAQDKLNDDDALTIAYQSGYYDGKKAAQPEQEPVAYTLNCVCGAVWDIKADGSEEMAHTPDTTPPQRPWVGMPEDEKEKFVIAYYPSNWDRKTAVALMNNYEAYLKEKNT